MVKISRVFLFLFVICFYGIISKAAVIEIGESPQIQIDYHVNLWPYVVSIQINDHHFCVGCFLRDRAILTDSKCVQENVRPANLSIKMPVAPWKKDSKLPNIKSIVRSHGTFAILFLEKPVKVPNVEIESYKNRYGGYIYHWTDAEKICAETALTGRQYNPHELPGTFSAITLPSEKCSADLGSPLILTSKGRKPHITGILSDKSQCSDAGYRYSFIDVDFHKEQIESIIETFENDEEEEEVKMQSVTVAEEKKEESTMEPQEKIENEIIMEEHVVELTEKNDDNIELKNNVDNTDANVEHSTFEPIMPTERTESTEKNDDNIELKNDVDNVDENVEYSIFQPIMPTERTEEDEDEDEYYKEESEEDYDEENEDIFN